jgi:hypothetical protein
MLVLLSDVVDFDADIMAVLRRLAKEAGPGVAARLMQPLNPDNGAARSRQDSAFATSAE